MLKLSANEKSEIHATKKLIELRKQQIAIEKSIVVLPAKEEKAALRSVLTGIKREISDYTETLEEVQLYVTWQKLVTVPMMETFLEVCAGLKGQPLTQGTLDFLKTAANLSSKVEIGFDGEKLPGKITAHVDALSKAAANIAAGKPLQATPWYPLQDKRQEAADKVWERFTLQFQNQAKMNDFYQYSEYPNLLAELTQEAYQLAKTCAAVLDGSQKKIGAAAYDVDLFDHLLRPITTVQDKIEGMEGYESGVKARRAEIEAERLRKSTPAAQGLARSRRI